jgi:hypothetical protein
MDVPQVVPDPVEGELLSILLQPIRVDINSAVPQRNKFEVTIVTDSPCSVESRRVTRTALTGPAHPASLGYARRMPQTIANPSLGESASTPRASKSFRYSINLCSDAIQHWS